jgi:uncharacterized membrane protein YjgN (DUF898 family)
MKNTSIKSFLTLKMCFRLTIVVLLTGLPWTVSIPVTIFNHSRFEPMNMSMILADLSSISSQQACLCQCFHVAMCMMTTYSRVAQRCLLFSTALEGGRLRVVADDSVTSILEHLTEGE